MVRQYVAIAQISVVVVAEFPVFAAASSVAVLLDAAERDFKFLVGQDNRSDDVAE